MDFKSLSFPEAPLIKIQPPGPRSKEYLSFQSAHEGSAVSYPRGMPMASITDFGLSEPEAASR